MVASRFFNRARTVSKFSLMATRPRKTTASTIMKMQVPAYCPAPFGVQALEYKGVLLEVKKTIFIESMPIMLLDEEPAEVDIGIELSMDMPDIVAVIVVAIDIVLPMSFWNYF
jgi:hypothetical protein